MPDVHLPPLGDTIDEARVTTWLKQVGDAVAFDEPLVSVETDKVETEIPSPLAGVLTAQLVREGETVDIGTVLAIVGDGEAVAEPVPAPSVTEYGGADAPTSFVGVADVATFPAHGGVATIAPRDNRVRTPLVRRLLAEHGLDPVAITGSGADGRITRDDVLAAARRIEPAATPAPAPVSVPVASPAVVDPPSTDPNGPDPIEDPHWQPFNRVRKVTGQRMLLSARTIPQVTTVMRVNYEQVYRARQEHGAAFRERTGQSLTYLPFVSMAAIRAIEEFPHLNASVVGSGLRVHPAVHLGIAVDLDFQGLMVPVVRDAQDLRIEALATRTADLANRARERRLGHDDLSGSTFTITNPGGFGTLAGTPLVNPPEVAILCVEGIAEEPVVVTTFDGSKSIAIHHIGHLSLSWDHRAIDGAYAAAFLARIRREIETRDWSAVL
ncbi:dihydrolipoamide acetyltransferase family protein [Nocardioides soli]|uniref:Dihydrolipoamide acetyltransferase component of pyruvate dehydrogenase complex n=1 Tax=Nocardioides soli TaxID=1036020 RepID=A0A7W4VW30_9ACTN|nr:dihydrolipoamide acetyltransferase family protein [Nocardioides soli]MBB3042851.1 2-oxoglutarate dehydrogenase E2 component (dihydrolipoamide succinyltransferase) [Nocardioides soli]